MCIRDSIYIDSVVISDPLRIEDRGTVVMASGSIDYVHDLDIEGYADFGNLAFLTDILRLENISGRGSAEFGFTGPVANPRVWGVFHSDSLFGYDLLFDSMDIEIDMQEFTSVLRGDLQARGGNFHYDRYDGDSLRAEVVFDSNRILLDTLEVYSQRLTSMLSLDIGLFDTLTEIEVPSISLVLDTFHIKAEDTVFLAVTDSLFNIEGLKLVTSRGHFNVGGKYYFDGRLDFDMQCTNLDLKPIFGFYVPEQFLTGIFEFSGEVGGTVSNPVFHIHGRADSVSMLNQEYGNIDFAIDYEDSSIVIDNFVLRGDENLTRISGNVPFNLALENVSDRIIRDRDINLSIDSRGTTFFLLPVILPDIEWIEGVNALDARITGSLDDPELNGHFYLSDGRIKTYYLANVLENVSANLRLEGRKIIFDKMISTTGNGSKTGNVSIDGFVSFDNLFTPTIELVVEAKNFPFQYDLGEIEGLIDKARIEVSGKDTITAVGDLELASFTYAEPFQPVIETEAMQALDSGSSFNYIIDITAPANLRVVNQDANVELGGELRVFKQGDFQNFYGSLETIRGKYYFFDQTFTVLPGGEIIFDDIDEFNPRLNIEVETHITSQGERLKAKFLLSGTLNEPKLTATEDSEVEEGHFFEWFSFQRFGTPGDTTGSPFTDRLKVGASEIAMNKVSQYFARRIGIETFEINPYYSGDEMNLEEAELRVGLYTTSNLYIYGATRLDFKKAREVGFEYRFSRHFYLSGQRDEHDLYHLNLNWNWEF